MTQVRFKEVFIKQPVAFFTHPHSRANSRASRASCAEISQNSLQRQFCHLAEAGEDFKIAREVSSLPWFLVLLSSPNHKNDFTFIIVYRFFIFADLFTKSWSSVHCARVAVLRVKTRSAGINAKLVIEEMSSKFDLFRELTVL